MFKKLSDIIKVVIGWYSILAELGVSVKKHCDGCKRIIWAPEFEMTLCKVCKKYMMEYYGPNDEELDKKHPEVYR